MRRFSAELTLALTLTFGGIVGVCRAEAPPAAVVPGPPAADTMLPADAPIDSVLDALDQRGKSMKDFTARVKLSESDAALGTSTTRLGQISFQKKPNDDARLRVLLDKKVQGKIAIDEKLDYLLDDGWFTDRDYRKQIEVKRQVVRPGEKIELLKLGKGPFPLPIGQSKEDVHGNFDVTKTAPTKDDPADSIHLTLKPKPGSSLANRFTSLDVWVDRRQQMPVRIDTNDAGGSGQRRTDLTDLKVNTPGGLPESNFTLPAVNKAQWNLATEPLPRETPNPGK